MSFLLMILRLLNIKLVINQTTPEWAGELDEIAADTLNRDAAMMDAVVQMEVKL